MYKKILHYFDKLEDRIRGRLSRYPIIYSIIGGAAIVLFWRGVWITADDIAKILPRELVWIDGPLSVAVSLIILLATGLFVSFFVSDQIIISGIKQAKRIDQKTEEEVRQEEKELKELLKEVTSIEKEVQEIHDNTHIKHHNHS
jgi:uncharacterized protein YlxW (UPF0749 family)